MPTTRVQPPKTRGAKTPQRGQAKATTSGKEVQNFLFKYRHQLRPYWAMLVVFLVALIVDDAVILAGSYALAAALIVGPSTYLRATKRPDGPAAKILTPMADGVERFLRLDRQEERVYAAILLTVAGGWSAWSTTEPIRPYLALPLLTTLLAIPWFKHRRVNKTIPRHVGDDLKGAERRRAETKLDWILNNWQDITRQGRIQFAECDGVSIVWPILSVDVTLRGGQAARSLQYPTARSHLESAFDAPAGSLRVNQLDKKRARRVRFQFILEDLNEAGLGAAPDEVVNMGRFETGGPVEFDDYAHTLIAGATGAGKSGLMNQAIRRKVKDPKWAVVGVDLKPGALEMGPWGPALAFLADDPKKAKKALEGLINGLYRRGDIMRERGWREWQATPAEPNICLAVDEVQLLRELGLMSHLEKLSTLSRAYGFQLILATQFPKDSNLPSTIMAQLRQIFCGRLKAPKDDRVVFGENATAEGWTPSAIPDGLSGTYYVRSSFYTTPQRARGWWMEVEQVVQAAAGGLRTMIDASTAPWLERGSEVAQISGGTHMDPFSDETADEVVDAVVVSDDPVTSVLEVVKEGKASGTDAIVDLTGINRTDVNLILRGLQESGQIRKPGVRVSKNRPWEFVG